MLALTDENTRPLDVEELIGNTRENGRNLDDYQAILERLGLPAIEGLEGGRILEIGTGQGSTLPGLFALTGSSGRVVSVDLDCDTLQKIPGRFPELPIRLHSASEKISTDPVAQIDVICESAETVYLPEAWFDRVVSIWVLYQVKDKARTLAAMFRALRPGGTMSVASGGSLCTVPHALDAELLAEVRDFVWNHRASRFSWLTGTRELAHILELKKVPHKIENLDEFVARHTRQAITRSPVPPGEQPQGHFVMTSDASGTGDLLEALSALSLTGFVSTRNSAFVPIYHDPHFAG